MMTITKAIAYGLALAVTISVLALVFWGGGGTAYVADPNSGFAAPTNVRAVDGAETGTAIVSWDAVAGASFYRIGWVSADDFAAVQAEGRHWLDAFVFSDVASQGPTSYTVLRLAPGVRHAFIVGSLNSRFSNAAWSDWAYLTTAAATAQCPTGGGEPPVPTATPGPTPTPAPNATPTPGTTATPTLDPGATLIPTPTASPTATPRPTAAPTPTLAPTATPTPTPTPVAVGTDYDQDNDGLIEIANLAQLDAVRYDLDGDGVSANADSYAAAFPNAAAGMGCANQQCRGYELAANLDFDTDGSGQINKGDTYWNDGDGWSPIGGVSSPFNTVLDGNGRTIANLHIDRTDTDDIGLLGAAGGNAVIRNVRLTGVRVSGEDKVGGLVGSNSGSISGSRAAGRVSGDGGIGGLAGVNSGSISSSSAAVAVSGSSGSSEGQAALGVFGSGNSVGGLAGVNPGTIADSHASGAVTGGGNFIGGLVGSGSASIRSCGTISRSYATGKVTGNGARAGYFVGGLIGSSCGAISGSYATGAVTGVLDVGGLVGAAGGSISDSYATSAVTGVDDVGGLVGKSSAVISGSYATGKVSATGVSGDITNNDNNYVGGLVGLMHGGAITASYATGSVSGDDYVGGLVGLMQGGAITASYATGSVTGNRYVGGLAGASGHIDSITASYATGSVSGNRDVGGLVGIRFGSSLVEVTGSYWDTQTTGQDSSGGGSGKTTRELQQPTEATGIYADWNAEHWDFGTAKQYPALKYGGMDVGRQRR